MTRMQTRIRRRTGVLVTLVAASTASAGSLASLASLTACSSAGPVPGCDKAQDGGLRLVVPSGWDKTVPQSSLWSTRWTDPADKSSVLMTAQSVSAADAYQALDLAMNAARASTRGYLPGARTAITDGGTVVARQDYQTSWPYANRGATWAVSSGSRISLIDFSGESITDQQLETAGRWIELA